MSKFMTYDYWVDNFQPMTNHLVDDGDTLHYETYGEEVEYVKLQDNKHIWTEVDGDSGTYIVAGWHFVNRINYYITNRPWTDEWTEIPTWSWRECDCVEASEDGEYDPNCEECEEGLVNISCDTVEDLKQIYGEDNEDIVG
jgi:hypothetical protein